MVICRDAPLIAAAFGRARDVLAKAPGLRLVDDPAKNEYPLPLPVAGKDECVIGRLRIDCALDNALAFWFPAISCSRGRR